MGAVPEARALTFASDLFSAGDPVSVELSHPDPNTLSTIEGASVRFRPILLTSVTPFLGVAPLVLETSLQAQFLIPRATSPGFGVVFATVILMTRVPALAMIQYNAEFLFKKKVLGKKEEELEVVHFSQHPQHEPEPQRQPVEEVE